MISESQGKLDAVIGIGAVSSPWWLPYVNIISQAASVLMWAGGFVLLVLRLAIAYRDWKRGR